MQDNAWRRVVKGAARLVTTIDLHATRAIQRALGRRPFRLGGDCHKCAACCESPGIRVPRLIFRFPALKRALLAWHRTVNGFVLRAEYPEVRTLIFECTHFDRATRRCDSYASRPGMCRDYPRLLLWESDPAFLPGCGYRAVSPYADRLAELVDREDLSPEIRERVKRALHAKKDD